MLRIVRENGQYCPVVVCDWCGQRIEEARQGNYEWEVDEHGLPATGEIFFTHKQCCLAFEEAHGGRSHWFASELSVLPVYLSRNLKVDREEAERRAELLSSI